MAKELADRTGATADQIYNYAWLAVSMDPDSLRRSGRSLPYALKAVEMSRGKNPQFLYVLAQTLCRNGQLQRGGGGRARRFSAHAPTPAGRAPAQNRAVAERALVRYRAQLKKR